MTVRSPRPRSHGIARIASTPRATSTPASARAIGPGRLRHGEPGRLPQRERTFAHARREELGKQRADSDRAAVAALRLDTAMDLGDRQRAGRMASRELDLGERALGSLPRELEAGEGAVHARPRFARVGRGRFECALPRDLRVLERAAAQFAAGQCLPVAGRAAAELDAAAIGRARAVAVPERRPQPAAADGERCVEHRGQQRLAAAALRRRLDLEGRSLVASGGEQRADTGAPADALFERHHAQAEVVSRRRVEGLGARGRRGEQRAHEREGRAPRGGRRRASVGAQVDCVMDEHRDRIACRSHRIVGPRLLRAASTAKSRHLAASAAAGLRAR